MTSPSNLQFLPSHAAVEAAVSLLADEDPTVARACREQLKQWGEPARPPLSTAVQSDEPRLRIRARALLRVLDLRRWSGEVRELLGAGREHESLLLNGCALLSAAGGDGMTSEELERRVRYFADRLRPRIGVRSSRTGAKLLSSLMASELGFRGDRACFYEPRNAQVHQVLERRRGLPISLSVLYLLVGRRAGLSMAGVGMPNHFLVRIHGVRPMLIDPFHGGRAVTKADCIRYLRAAGYGSSATDHLRDLHDREVLLSLARTLLRAYGNRRDEYLCDALGSTLNAVVP